MRSVIFGIGLFLMCLSLSYLLVKSTLQYWMIHRRLRISMASFRKEWNDVKHPPAGQFDLLNLVFRSAIFQLYPKMKMKRKRLEQLVSGELKRMVKYGWGASFSVFGRGLLATVMIGMSVFSGHVVWQDAKQFDVAAWLEPKQVNSEASALGKTFKLPYEIRSPKTLGTAIAFHMSRFDDHFTIQYTGDATNMKQTLDAAWEWVEQNHIYIYRLQRGGESEFREQNGSVDITIRLEYDMTAEEAEQVQARVDQVIAQMPKQLSQVEKVKYINDYVVMNTTYHLDSQASPYTPIRFY
nr:hypothetical protein [Exiguobacterium algae]